MQHWLTPAVIAFLCWGLWAFLPKITTRYIDPRSALVYEALGGLVVGLLVLATLGLRPAADGRGLLLGVATGMLGVGGALAYLFAMTRGPVTLISTITALYPIISVLLAYAFLHEAVTLRQGLGIVLALVAMMLIAG